MERRGRQLLWFVAIGGSCLALLLYRAISEAWVTDDALISFRYARNLADGNGLVYNVGERVEGFSNPLFVLLLTPFSLLGLDLFGVSEVLGILFGVCELALLLWLLHRVTASRVVMGFVGVLFASDRIVAVWTTGGLETSMHGALLMLALALAVVSRERPDRGVVRVTLVHIALVASRPEGALFYGLYLAHLFFSGRADGTWRRNVLRSGLIFGQGLLVLLVLRYAYYGELVANPYRAKLEGVPHAELSWVYTKGFLVRMGWASLHAIAWLAFAAAVAFALIARRRDRSEPASSAAMVTTARQAWLFVALGVAAVAYMGGDYMTDFRFYRPIMGALYLGLGVVLALALSQSATAPRVVALVGAAALMASHLHRQVEPTPIASDAPPPALHKRILTIDHFKLEEFTSGLNKFAQPGDKLLVDWAGYRGYGHNLYTIDATGLVSKTIAGDFYLRPAYNEFKVRERLPGHARWPEVAFMQREKFTFIFPKISDLQPTQPEIHRRAPRRHRRYPFIHVSVPHRGRYLRFFTTLTGKELFDRAHALEIEMCYREPWEKLRCYVPGGPPESD